MRVVFVPADMGGCMYYRCWVPGLHLRLVGHQVHFARSPWDMEVQRADVVVFQRQCGTAALEVLPPIRARGGVVFHEFDDNFHEVPPTNPHAIYYNDSPSTQALENWCIEADALLVSTPDLAAEYARFNPRAFICYNALDDRQATRLLPKAISGTPKRTEEIRIGYAGGGSHSGDFAMIAPAVTVILREFPMARLVFIGACYRQHLPDDVWDQTEFPGGTGSAADIPMEDPRFDATTERRLASVAYYDMVRAADFDIGIAPLEPVTFNRCKSYVKLIEYGALGIPALASRFGPYAQYQAEAGETVIALASTVESWQAELRSLILSAVRRAQLANANLRYVQRAHLMSRRVQAWVDSFGAVMADNNLRVRASNRA